MSSNVGQNYPYTSEIEADRATAVAAVIEAHPELAGTIATEATPLDANDRWWVWKCPTPACAGLLHAAGFARSAHAVYSLCDTCGKTYLR